VNRSEAALALIALVVFLFGLLVLAVPQVAALVPVSEPFVVLVGVCALLFGALAIRKRTRIDIDQATTPDPERPAELPIPGDDVDELIAEAGLTVPHRHEADPRRTLRRRLEETACTTLVEQEGYSRADAEAELREGTWTDDPHAIAFFTGRLPEETPLGLRIRTRLAVRDPFARRARNAAAAIATIAGVDA
jgi:hypothetical protein